MQAFSFSALSLLTGIRAQTLRIWEQRIEFFRTRPRQGRKRLYSSADLEKLLRISFLYQNGWEILRISLLSDEELLQATKQVAVEEPKRKTFPARLLQATLALNEAAFANVIDEAVAAVGFERTVTDIIHPFWSLLDVLGEAGNGLPLRKPFASYLLEARMIAETEKLPTRPAQPPDMVLYSPDKAQHAMPLLFLNYLLRKHRWKVLYLGSGVGMEKLKEVAASDQIGLMLVHFAADDRVVPIDDYLAALRKSFPSKPVIATGRGLEDNQRKFTGLLLLKRDEEVIQLIERGPTLARLQVPPQVATKPKRYLGKT